MSKGAFRIWTITLSSCVGRSLRRDDDGDDGEQGISWRLEGERKAINQHKWCHHGVQPNIVSNYPTVWPIFLSFRPVLWSALIYAASDLSTNFRHNLFQIHNERWFINCFRKTFRRAFRSTRLNYLVLFKYTAANLSDNPVSICPAITRLHGVAR